MKTVEFAGTTMILMSNSERQGLISLLNRALNTLEPQEYPEGFLGLVDELSGEGKEW
jgi:hypothetical protein